MSRSPVRTYLSKEDLDLARIEKGKKLMSLRIKSKMTKTELSIKSGLTRKTIDGIESGLWNITTDTETLYINALKKQTS